MSVKYIEIRDRMTAIPAMIIKPSVTERQDERYLARSVGCSDHTVYLLKLSDGKCHYDPYTWSTCDGRTMKIAHTYCVDHFDEIQSGDVIDVEYVLGESKTKKIAQFLELSLV